jgi:methylenetetrahydrofolate reductase (NADPH)
LSRLEQALAEGRFVVTAEMPTIDGGGMDEVRFQLEPMAPYLDACNATDNTAAHAHASPLAIAIALQRCGMEPIMQLVCRDRNRLALEADLVGASLHGIENVCCLTGDDVTAGDEPEARRVFDLDSPQLLVAAAGIARGRYLSGRPITPPPHLFLGAVENPGAPPHAYRAERALKKVRAGARFLQLQICFEPRLLEGFAAEAERVGVTERAPLLPSITILRSARALRFIDEKVPGISVPADVIARVESAEDQQEACFDVAYELARHALAQPGVRGLHFISFRKDAGIAALCRRLGIPTHAERVEHGYRSPVPV